MFQNKKNVEHFQFSFCATKKLKNKKIIKNLIINYKKKKNGLEVAFDANEKSGVCSFD